MREPVSVGIVGAGAIAANMHVPVLRAMPDVRLAWLADTSAERVRTVAKANRLQAVHVAPGSLELPPADVVLLAIPLHVRDGYFDHYAQGTTAVLAEKPFAQDAAGHRRVLGLYDDWRLACGYQRRHYATSRMLRSIISARVFGPVRTIRMREGSRVTRAGTESYVDRPVAQGGGIIKNLGCHSLDLALWLTGAQHAVIRERQVEWDGDTDRHATARLRLTGGEGANAIACDLEWAVSWLEPQRNELELEFETAIVRSPITAAEAIEVRDRNGALVGTMPVAPSGGARTINQAFHLEWSDVIAGVRSKAACTLSARSCLPVAEVMDVLLDRRSG